MYPTCTHCGLDIAHDGGYYLGAIYINYGWMALGMTAAYLALWLGTDISPDVFIWPLFAGCLLLPLLSFRHARAFWLGLDELIDPHQRTPREDTAGEVSEAVDRPDGTSPSSDSR